MMNQSESLPKGAESVNTGPHAAKMPTPFWQSDDGRHVIYCADCLTVLPHLTGVDAVVTSPPYNQNIDTFKPSGMHKESRWVEKISKGYFDSMSETEYQSWQVRLLDAIFDVSKETASVFYNHKCRWRDGEIIWPIDWIRRSKWRIRQEVIWQRNGSCTMNARMFAPNDERIFWLCKEKHKWNQSAVSFFTVWQMASEVSEHACAFPIEYPLRAISAATDKDDLVVEPFCGSGTTGVACIRTGRRFIGVEISEAYCKIAVQRMERELSQPCLPTMAPDQQVKQEAMKL